jgi:hypothetical protein
MEALVNQECGIDGGEGGSKTPDVLPNKNPGRAKKTEIDLPLADRKGLQAALALLGYDIGKIDGSLGTRTRTAIADIQKRYGLPITGEIDEATLSQIIKLAQEIQAQKDAANSACAALDELKSVDFEREWRGAVARVEGLKELRQEIMTMRSELASDRFYQAGLWREATAELLQTATTCGHLVTNLLKVNPITGAAVTVSRRVEDWGKIFLEGVKARKRIDLLVRHELDKLALDVLLDYGQSRDPIILGVKTVYDFANDLTDLAKIPLNFSDLRDEIDTSIARLDRQLRDIESRLNDSTEWIKMREDMMAAAAQACRNEKAEPRLVQP